MKPRCRSIQHRLSDYIDDTLSSRQTVIVAQHLRFCRKCQRELESLRRTAVLLHLYVPPLPPAGYYEQFGEQLQRLIEKQPRPVWWDAPALLQASTRRFQAFLHQSIYPFSERIGFPIGWVKLSAVYTWMLLAVLASLFAYQFSAVFIDKFLQPQEQNLLDATNLSHVLKVQPTSPLKRDENRELISNREQLFEIVQALPEPVVQGGQNPDKEIDIVESPTELLRGENYPPDPVSDSGLISDSDAFKTMAIHDASLDLMAVAQLSSPAFIAAREHFAQPLGVVVIPSSSEIGRGGNRSLNGFVDMLMNVQLPNFSITEVYNSVKL